MQLNVAESKLVSTKAAAIRLISDHGAHAAALDLGVDFMEGKTGEKPSKHGRDQ